MRRERGGKCYKCNGDVTVTDVTFEPIFNAPQHTECVENALDALDEVGE